MDVDGSEASSATHTKMALGSGDVNEAHKALYFSTGKQINISVVRPTQFHQAAETIVEN